MEALRHYRLDEPRVVSTFPSERNRNVLVEDRAGQKLVVRRFERNSDRRRIAFQLEVQQQLAERGIPTPAVVPTTEGRLITPDEPHVAFEFVDGTANRFTRLAQAEVAARMLALVQDALDEIRVAEVRAPLNPHVERWWREPRRELDARAAYASRQELADLEQILQDLDLGGLATLPTGLIHGDFHGRNLLFRGDEIVAVLDFDVVHTTVRSVDVARALLAFARPRRGSLEVRPKFAAAFLSRYECRRPLIDEEHTALPTLLTLVFMPRAEKCELLAAEGDDPAAWVTGRIKTVAEVAQRRAGLLKVIASVR